MVRNMNEMSLRLPYQQQFCFSKREKPQKVRLPWFAMVFAISSALCKSLIEMISNKMMISNELFIE